MKHTATKAATAAIIAAGMATKSHAQTDLIPPTGVDTAAFITEAIQSLSAIVGVAVGGYFAFLLIRRGMRWASTALR